MAKMSVYKLKGEAYEINESPCVYVTKELALEDAKDWEEFLGMPIEEAFDIGEIFIEEWELHGI